MVTLHAQYFALDAFRGYTPLHQDVRLWIDEPSNPDECAEICEPQSLALEGRRGSDEAYRY